MAARVELGWSNAELRAGAAQGERIVSDFANNSKTAFNSLKGMIAGAFSVAAVQQFAFAVKGLLSDFDDISDAATKLGISAESFQRLKLQAELAGASVDGLSTAMLKMSAELQRGGDGADKINAALASLNINAAQFKAASPEQQIALLAAGFQKARAEGKGLAEIQDLFKKQFTELIPLLSTSSAELDRLAQKKVVSAEDVAALAAANDAIDEFANDLKIVAGISLAGLIDGFKTVETSIRSATNGLLGLWDVIKAIDPSGILGLGSQIFQRGQNQAAPPTAPAAPAPVDPTSAAGTTNAYVPPGLTKPITGGVLPFVDLADKLSASFTPPQAASAARTARTAGGNQPGDFKELTKLNQEQLETLRKLSSY